MRFIEGYVCIQVDAPFWVYDKLTKEFISKQSYDFWCKKFKVYEGVSYENMIQSLKEFMLKNSL